MQYFKLFGLGIGCNFNLEWPLEPINNPEKIDCQIIQKNTPIKKVGDIFFTVPTTNSHSTSSRIQIRSSEFGLILTYSRLGDFKIQRDKVICYLQNQYEQRELESFLFRIVLVLWLELVNMPVLHASGVSQHNMAIGFLANSVGGKSTLAAACLRYGAQFMTDDIFPVKAHQFGYQAHPSYAWLRLLPETAQALGYKSGTKDADPAKVAVRLDEKYGRFCPGPVPLSVLYLPERRNENTSVLIEKLSPKDAYLGLLQHSFLGKWLVNSPLNARRMAFLSRLALDVPIKRLIYPSGYEHLPAVMAAVQQDLGL